MPIDVTAIREDAHLNQLAEYADAPRWLYNLRILWGRRTALTRIAACAFVANLVISLLIPKTYVSQARIMPPETSGSSSALFAALAGRAFGSEALGGLAAAMLGGRNSGALFVELLRSGSVSSRMIDRFDLQKLYHKRYRVDAAKVLARRTTIVQDKKSGVLTIAVKDTDPKRARDMAQAYLDELNVVVTRTSTSPAHQERVFIEERLKTVRAELERAQEAMSDFSSTHTAIDLKEQARATVESEAKLQGELIVAQAELGSIRQIYGDQNVRVRASEARIASLKRELSNMGGSSAPLAASPAADQGAEAHADNAAYLPLRQLPRLAVPYANLYREVRVQETVYDLLVQQYEVARIQEAKDIPAVNIIDAPGVPEKKSFPPRAVLTIAMTLVVLVASSLILVWHHHWLLLNPDDPRRRFGREVAEAIRTTLRLRRMGRIRA